MVPNVHSIYIMCPGRCLPSKHLLVFKTSWRHVLKTSSARLQSNNFTSSKTSWRRLTKTFSRPLARRLEDIFKTSWKTKNCYAEDIFKTSWGHVLKTYLEDVFKTSRRQTKFLLVISVSNKSKCVSNKSLFHKLYLRNLRRIQNASLRTQ